MARGGWLGPHDGFEGADASPTLAGPKSCARLFTTDSGLATAKFPATSPYLLGLLDGRSPRFLRLRPWCFCQFFLGMELKTSVRLFPRNPAGSNTGASG